MYTSWPTCSISDFYRTVPEIIICKTIHETALIFSDVRIAVADRGACSIDGVDLPSHEGLIMQD